MNHRLSTTEIGFFVVGVITIAFEVSSPAVGHGFAGKLRDGLAAIEARILLLSLFPHRRTPGRILDTAAFWTPYNRLLRLSAMEWTTVRRLAGIVRGSHPFESHEGWGTRPGGFGCGHCTSLPTNISSV